jgi:hypothetical protein
MGYKRRQGNMAPQNVNNHTIEDLVDNDRDGSSITEVRRMIVRMFKELKKELSKQLNESQISHVFSHMWNTDKIEK